MVRLRQRGAQLRRAGFAAGWPEDDETDSFGAAAIASPASLV
jgi:hypothetical protein